MSRWRRLRLCNRMIKPSPHLTTVDISDSVRIPVTRRSAMRTSFTIWSTLGKSLTTPSFPFTFNQPEFPSLSSVVTIRLPSMTHRTSMCLGRSARTPGLSRPLSRMWITRRSRRTLQSTLSSRLSPNSPWSTCPLTTTIISKSMSKTFLEMMSIVINWIDLATSRPLAIRSQKKTFHSRWLSKMITQREIWP